MKKYILFVFMLAMVQGFVACSNDEDVIAEQSSKSQKITFVACGEGCADNSTDAKETRTSLDNDNNVLWSAGDVITINGSEFKIKSGIGSTSATFEGDALEDGTYVAYYGTDGQTLPTTQNYVANSNISFAPMYAEVKVENNVVTGLDGGTVKFKNLLGLLCIQLKDAASITSNISNITISSTEEPLAGKLDLSEVFDKTLDDEYRIPSPTAFNEYVVTLDCGDTGVPATNKFYIALPQKGWAYAKMNIFINTVDGKTYEKYIDKKFKVNRSQISLIKYTAGAPSIHTAVDLGLSVKWATMNVGATSETDAGSYFAWGVTVPKTGNFDWTNYRFAGQNNDVTKYNAADNKTTLEIVDDAVTAYWGGRWRMPTKGEMEELLDGNKCEWSAVTETTGSGNNQTTFKGYKVTSKINGNSIYLPVTGMSQENTTNKTDGYYWTSTVDTKGYKTAYALYFNINTKSVGNSNQRYYGLTIRPVCP